MLVETKKNLAGKVVVLKLITGEEIIARAGTHEGDKITVKNPLSMVMVPSDDANQGMVAFAPWMLSLDDDVYVEIVGSKYVVLAEAKSEASEQYSRAIGEQSDIAVVQPKTAPQVLGGARKGGRGR